MSGERAEPVRIEVTVSAPVDVVWRSLREPAELRRWHGWHYDALDEEIDEIFRRKAREGERPYTLQMEPGDVFELQGTTDGTVVRIIRSVPDPGTDWANYFPDITEGWISFLQQLRFMLERHPGQERRTLYLETGRTEIPPDPLAATSPAAGGERWFSSDNQRGLVVEGLGPGLAIIGVKPADGDAAMVIVTTYGQDDAAFASTRETWTNWWQRHHPDAPAAVV